MTTNHNTLSNEELATVLDRMQHCRSFMTHERVEALRMGAEALRASASKELMRQADQDAAEFNRHHEAMLKNAERLERELAEYKIKHEVACCTIRQLQQQRDEQSEHKNSARADSAERMMVSVATVFGEFSREQQDLMDWCRRFTKWKHCMSYNDSYFGEPAGELKRIAYEIERILPVVPLPAAPQPQGESN